MEGRSWESLRHALESPRVGLIFHCRNHYAGIFAMREWAEGVSRHGTTCILLLRMAGISLPAGPHAAADLDQHRGPGAGGVDALGGRGGDHAQVEGLPGPSAHQAGALM